MMLLLAASAAVGSTSSVSLTLNEALAKALEQNEEPHIAKARFDRAQALRREAVANLIPSLDLSGAYTRRSMEVSRMFGGDTIVIQRQNALSADAALSIDVVDAPSWALLSAANHAEDAVELEAGEARRRLAFMVAASFYEVLSLEHLGAAAKERRIAAEETADDARRRVEAGLAARNEATRTELEVATARLAEKGSSTAVLKGRLELGFLVGESIGDRELVEPEARPRPPLSVASLEMAAFDRRADLEALSKRTAAARARATEPWLRLVPTLGVLGMVRAANETGIVGRAVDGNVSATLSWELFDGGARYARADAEAASVVEAELVEKMARRRVLLELETALADIADADASVEEAGVRARVAEENAAEVRALFANGLASALEQVDASVSEFESKVELSRQRVRRRISELRLYDALGEWPDGPVEGGS